MEKAEIKDADVNETSIDKEKENPTNDVVENEEIVGTLTDTSEDSEDKASKSEEDKQSTSVEEKTFTQKEVDKMIEARVNRLESANRKKMQEYEDLVNTLKVGTGEKIDTSLKDLNKKFKEFYREQGVEIPEASRQYSEREEKILAKADAQEIIEAGEDEVRRVATEIYNKPAEQRTMREKFIYSALGEHVMKNNAIKDLEKKGADTKILENDEFKKFASKFSAQTSIGEIYDLYNKVITKPEEVKKIPPASTGSVKTTENTAEIKDYYTPEEVSKFTMEELKNNPKLMKAVDKSMAKWK